jgi:hypothetical protein
VDRSHVVTALLALLAVLALGVSAATLDDTSDGTGGGGVGDSDSTGVGGDEGFSFRFPETSATGSLDPLIYRLLMYLFGLMMLVATVVFLVNVYREYGLRGLAGLAVAAVATILVLVALSYLFQGIAGPSGPGGGANDSAFGIPGGSAGDEGSEGTRTSPPPLLGGVFLLVLLGGVLLLVRATGDDTHASDPAPSDRPETEQLGRVAGEAADRIARGAVTDNEVYRAWREMTDLLEVPNPDACTPAEFADAAVETGLDRDDVAELTSLFEDVRYGHREPTEAREERALAALRRIEEAYA